MKSAHNNCRIALLLPFFIATCSLAASAETGIVNAKSGLSLRATPAASGKLLQKLPHGTRIEILDKNGPAAQIEGLNGNWFKIKNKSNIGWVFGGFIKAAVNDQTNEARPANSLVQTVSAAAQNTDTDLADSEAASNGFDFVGREKQLLKKYSNKLSRRQKS
ncbi:MAG: SH3 domain-containing protein, partial [Candidatus Riflebacteria bacterium]|nr:SH3 domain-containing protein [Candidatus Riflebacteria bacterium]